MKYIVIRDDISKFSADAIVLPANPSLRQGSGTSTAIFEAAGKEKLTNECKKLIKENGKFEVGTAASTLAFDLDADVIIHAICPRWIDGKHDEYAYLSSAYRSSLESADDLDCMSIAFPLLSSGNNKFDLELAFAIADETITEFEPKNKLTTVYLIVYGKSVVEMIKAKDIPVQENIKDSYVTLKDEKYISPSKEFSIRSHTVGKELLSKAISIANKKMQDPVFQKKVLKIGKAVFLLVINDKFNKKEVAKIVVKNIFK